MAAKSPALICHAPAYDHSWVHLSVDNKPEGSNQESATAIWRMTWGYPFEHPPEKSLLKLGAFVLPEQARITNWSAGICATLEMDGETNPLQIANLVREIMTQVQMIPDDEPVEVVLEFT